MNAKHLPQQGCVLSDNFSRSMNAEFKTLFAEKSRDRWLAAEAATHFTYYGSLTECATEPLEALGEMIRQELQDRDLREQKAAMPELPF